MSSQRVVAAVCALFVMGGAWSEAWGQAPAGAVVILSAPSVEGVLHAQLQQGATSLLKQLDEVAHLSSILLTMKDVVRTSNEIASFVRFGKEVFDTLRNYSLADLINDAQNGLYGAFPELRELEGRIDLALDNAKSIEAGPQAFFSLRDYRDRQNQRLFFRAAKQAYAARVYPQVFPMKEDDRRLVGNADTPERNGAQVHPQVSPANDEDWRGISEADKLVQQKFARDGLINRVAIENATGAALGKHVLALVDEAESKQRLDLALMGSSARAQHQLMVDTSFMRVAREAEIAEQEGARLMAAERERKLQEQLESNADEMFGAGRIR